MQQVVLIGMKFPATVATAKFATYITGRQLVSEKDQVYMLCDIQCVHYLSMWTTVHGMTPSK